MQTTVTVLGGLEITVEFRPCRAEPDVGLMSDYVEEWETVEIAGRPLRKGEEDRILQACYDAMESARYSNFED